MMERTGSSSKLDTAMAVLRSPGVWILFGGLEALFLIHLAEFLYPGYSVAENYVSDLGVGPMPASAIFAVSVVLFGAFAILAAALLRRDDSKSLLWVFLALSGIGAIGVGVFDFNHPLVHRPSALLAFLFGNLAAVYSCKVVRPPLSLFFAALGSIGLLALALFGAEAYLGLGVGGMERMILYPTMFWAVGFGGYLLAEESRTSRS